MIKVLKRSEVDPKSKVMFPELDMSELESDQTKLLVTVLSVIINEDHVGVIEELKNDKSNLFIDRENLGSKLLDESIELLEGQFRSSDIMNYIDKHFTKRILLFAVVSYGKIMSEIMERFELRLKVARFEAKLGSMLKSSKSPEELIAELKTEAKKAGLGDIGVIAKESNDDNDEEKKPRTVFMSPRGEA